MSTPRQTEIVEGEKKLVPRYFGTLASSKERYILIGCQLIKAIQNSLFLSQWKIVKKLALE